MLPKSEFADRATNSEEFHDASADEISDNMNHLTVEDEVEDEVPPAESKDFVGDVATDAAVEEREVEMKESLEEGPVIEQNTVVQSADSNEQIDNWICICLEMLTGNNTCYLSPGTSLMSDYSIAQYGAFLGQL